MTAPLPLTEIVVLRICPNCNASGCRMCNGVGRVPVDPYRANGGEQGEEPSDAPQDIAKAILNVIERGAPFDEPTNGVVGSEVAHG